MNFQKVPFLMQSKNISGGQDKEWRIKSLKQRIKIDLSTDDVITPLAIRYSYRLYKNCHTKSIKSMMENITHMFPLSVML